MPPKDELLRRFENTTPASQGKANVVLEWKAVIGKELGAACFLWFRLRGNPIETLFFNVVQWDSMDSCASPEEAQRFAEYSVSNSWLAKNFYRVVWLPDTVPDAPKSWVALRPEGAGLVTGEGEHYANWNSPKFAVMSFDFVRDAPQNVLKNWIERAIEADSAHWQRAVRWALLTPEGRFWLLVSWEQGNESQWMALIRALLQLDAPREPSENPISRQVDVDWGLTLPTLPVPLQLDLQGSRIQPYELVELARDHFGATVNYSEWRIKRHIRMPFSPMLRNPQVAVSHPTHHELMEALDLWREFGRQSGQLARVEELLGQLLT